MRRTVDIFVRERFRARLSRQLGGLPRAIRYARRLEQSQVVIDDFEQVDVALVTQALAAALPTALVTSDHCSVPANGVISAIGAAFGKRHRIALMVAPARAALRVALARLNGAEDTLIAHAAIVDSEIRVWSCEPRPYQCPVEALHVLRGLAHHDLARFEISSSGSRIHWPAVDIDLSLDDFREVCDPAFAREQRLRAAEELGRYGEAIRSLRVERGLRQASIEGLSEREVRRIEQGKHSPQVGTLRKLADAHGMPLRAYLDELAKRG